MVSKIGIVAMLLGVATLGGALGGTIPGGVGAAVAGFIVAAVGIVVAAGGSK